MPKTLFRPQIDGSGFEFVDAFDKKEFDGVHRKFESTIDEAQASAALMAFLAEHTTKKMAPLAGNSIHQDRRFVARYLPEVEDWLHYRNVDVSTIKELAKRWYPKPYAGRPTKKGSHRAMDDLLESIEELKYYREHLICN